MWQNLVTEFITFEKSSPPAGVSLIVTWYLYLSNFILLKFMSTTSRPGEIAKWIKSKKKDYVPLIKPGFYGPLFMKWWKGLQPSWRAQGDTFLSRNTPTVNNWSVLRKGGSAGLYTVVIGLSWWIKAQTMQRNADSWIIVDDITWVIHQMNMDVSGNLAQSKRSCEDDTDEVNQRVTKR